MKPSIGSRKRYASYPAYSYTQEDDPEALVKANLQGHVIDVGGDGIEVGLPLRKSTPSGSGTGESLPLYARLPGIFLERLEWEEPPLDPYAGRDLNSLIQE